MSDTRLDTALVDRGLARSRTAAARAIAAGDVRVDGAVVTRPSVKVADDAVLEVGGVQPVSRAAHKLEAALDAFGLDPSGRLALDLGASTGGFTALLLERGAARVVALDVGHDQLAPEVREDPRVVVVEGENARDLTPARLAELAGTEQQPSLVVADLSFISLAHVLPPIAAVLEPRRGRDLPGQAAVRGRAPARSRRPRAGPGGPRRRHPDRAGRGGAGRARHRRADPVPDLRHPRQP